ncbi:cellobiose transport system substrate-binding protein [Saccharothrix ecbatanensis]|uniref:Cellobiose transport system substrate-binding protein n=1 Tax=Saccharothrix ecbatanensis TaxID=1105145 RepID=A0A7W9HKF5_9PSEU|nr:extracellular solute-binding protein [Saccharothrix ecbatanensis]MBB5803558.1 cellobiose transport system substrate-binding protein [Saccharothrix ecbatanensis]
MRTSIVNRASAAIAAATAAALVLAGCSTDGSKPTGDGKIVLEIATFGDWGYGPYIEQWEAKHPNVTVEYATAGGGDDQREKLLNFVGQDSGLACVEALEVDWLGEFKKFSDRFVDLSDPELEDRWFDWKSGAATTEDGKVIGYGTDIGPQAVAYRADLFKAAGLPSDREAVAAYLGGDNATWERFYEVGAEFTAKSDSAWFESVQGAYTGMVNQVEYAYENKDGTRKNLAGSEVEKIFRTVLKHGTEQKQSAGLTQWSSDWNASFKRNDTFAVVMAPSWMSGTIKGNAGDDFVGWDIANVFPGGGGNWGGSYLSVPAQCKHPEEAKDLAAYLTSAEVALDAAVKNGGGSPSQVEAMNSPKLLPLTSPFFNNAPTGQIWADRAAAVKVVPFKGPNYKKVHDVIVAGLNRVDVDKSQSVDQSWAQVLSELESLN